MRPSPALAAQQKVHLVWRRAGLIDRLREIAQIEVVRHLPIPTHGQREFHAIICREGSEGSNTSAPGTLRCGPTRSTLRFRRADPN